LLRIRDHRVVEARGRRRAAGGPTQPAALPAREQAQHPQRVRIRAGSERSAEHI